MKIWKSLLTVVSMLFLTLVLQGCGDDKVSWETQESNRATARKNSDYNASVFRSKNSMFSSWDIFNDGDSSINEKCSNGDGWSSLTLTDPSDPRKSQKIKCSTISKDKGCLKEQVFRTKKYAQQDGHCAGDSIPKILPKIQK